MKIKQPFSVLQKEVLKHSEKSLLKIKEVTLRSMSVIGLHQNVSPQVVLDSMNSKVNTLITEIRTMLSPRIKELSHAIEAMRIEQYRMETESTMQNLQRNFNAVLSDQERIILTYPFGQLWKWKWSIRAICFADVLVAYGAFQSMGNSLIISLFFALLIAFGLALGAEELGKRINEASTSRKKWMIFTFGLIAASSIFLGLAYLRNVFFSNMHQTMLISSPLASILLNACFFSIATFIAMRFMPAKQEEMEYAAYKELTKNSENFALKIKQLKKDQEIREHDYLQSLLDHAETETFLKDIILLTEKHRESMTHDVLFEYALKGGTQRIQNR